ncbi:hypothetical protein EHF33_20130 (plasmid) [Deinococcus psychrotolerans]|uniref:Uncharacterized protein n=1 Tax=Deinococcus psychrotolerans TaxID=2489213 RepID=A0A3G8YKL6_9DEIO|nr:hypothetical protein [Deinococcus psychrotolerans]AZI45220.1 hypothetical protein EHF33_20130 [Deinococcus psychrotolerans]
MTTPPPLIKKGLNQRVVITDAEKQALDVLYNQQGAWTHDEAVAAFGDRLQFALDQKILGRIDTLMGTMYIVLGHGRLATFDIASQAESLQVQISKAYVRLSLLELGWRVMTDTEPSRKLKQFNKTGTMLHVETDFGECLLTGHLRSGGYSRQALDSLSVRFKSTALFHNFYIVVLTPSPRRGRDYAERQKSFLKLIHVLPQSTVDGQTATRVKTVPARHGFEPDDRPYYADAAWIENPHFQSLPDITKRVLSLSRTDRIGEARRALECDAAMSGTQLKKYFGLDVVDLEGVRYVDTIIRPAKRSMANEINTTFLTWTRQIANGDDTALAHRCGTAEVRYMLGADSNRELWQAEARGALSYDNPDAVYVPGNGRRIAVEFDAGSYSPSVIRNKLDTFSDRGFEETIWAVTTSVRQRNLTQKIGARLQRGVLLANWWK